MKPRDVMNAYLKWYHTAEGTSLMVDMAKIWKHPQVPHMLCWLACQDEDMVTGGGNPPHNDGILQHDCYTKNDHFRTKNRGFSNKNGRHKK